MQIRAKVNYKALVKFKGVIIQNTKQPQNGKVVSYLRDKTAFQLDYLRT